MKHRNRSGAFFSHRRIAGAKAAAVLSAAALAGVISASHAKAASQTWTGATDGNWTTTTDWSGSAVPGSTSGATTNTDTATFTFANTANTTITVDSGRNIKTIVFDNTFPPGTAPTYTLIGGPFALTSGGSISTTAVVSGTETINTNLVLEPASGTTAGTYSIGLTSPYTAGAGSLNITGNISSDTTTAGSTLTFNGTNFGFGSISGSISNGGAVAGLGLVFSSGNNVTWALSGTNTYSGSTLINGDTVIFNTTGSISSASVMNLSGGAVVFGSGVAFPTSNFNVISGGLGYAGGILDTGFISWVNSLPAMTAGKTSLLIDSAADASTNVNFAAQTGNAAVMALGANGSYTYTGTITPNATLGYQLGGGSGTLTLAQPLTDANGPGTPVTVIGNAGGNVVMNPSNTYTGITTLGTGGILVASNLAVEGASGGVASSLGESNNSAGNLVFSGGTLRYVGAAATMDRGFTINTSGTIDSSGTGTLNLSGASIVLATGAGRTLTLTGTGAGILNTAFSDNGTGIGSLTKSGTGTWTLAGTDVYSGTTTLSSGHLNIANSAALGTSTLALNGGTLDNTTGSALTINNSQTWGGNFNFAGSGSLNTGTAAVTLTGTRTVTFLASSFTIPGVISGSGDGITKQGSGTLNLLGADTYSGATSVNGGLVSLGTTGSITTSPLTLGDGQFSLSGVGLGATRSTSTSGTLTDNSGLDTITLTTDATQYISFTAGSLANRSAGSIELYRGPNLGVNVSGTANSSNIFFSTAPSVNNSGGVGTPAPFVSNSGNTNLGVANAPVLRGALIDNTGATGNGVGFATYDPTYGVRLLNPATEQLSVTSTSGYAAATTDDNVLISSTSGSPITALSIAGKTTNTLQLNNTNGTTLMTITNTATALLPTNGLLFTGTGPITLTGSSLTYSSGSGSVGNDMSILSTDTGLVTISTALANTGTPAKNYTFGGPGNFAITVNPGSASTGGDYYDGPGTVTLTTSGYGPSSAGTIVNGGTLIFGTGFALSSSVTRPASIAAGATLNINNIAIASTGTSGIDALNNVNGLGGTVTNTGGTLTNLPLSLNNVNGNFAGSITGNINLIIAKQGATTNNTQVLTGINTYAGSTLVTSDSTTPGQTTAILQIGNGGSLEWHFPNF